MRWAPDTRSRLERAALELFSEQGYTATTVPQITARAGLTTRTFFRYFADKREVLFGGSEVPDMAAALIREAPPELRPMDVIRHVLHQVAAARFDGQRERTAAWRRIINANDSLRDRDARKRADLVLSARTAFVERGESPLSATLHAEVGALVFHVALEEWLTEPEPRPMAETVDDVLTRIDVTIAADESRDVPPGDPVTASDRP
ncbi:TetR family transcriptional regulator [Cryptosporangium arvum]|uniref:Transcriptional regulator n=1 Tax=Cryptosporangium arvum DSM 44712 TaxID=927661 RepID=A0A010ZYT1_9ACTN|nr:TetR/AcrR family transcriptional regulator [Cryptosporangium arvum]EXG82367.1 transcriptional regulator [Cryptosporangium arvum DSM 44712]